MHNKLKKFALRVRAWLSNLGVRAWLSKEHNCLKNIAYIVAIGTLMCTAVQASIATSELKVSRADLEARTRPYLSIERIGLNNTGDGWISTTMTINNRGEIPATRVRFGDILLNGTKIAGTGQPDKDYPARVHTTEDGVTVTAEGLVVTPTHLGPPDDMIFFPQKPTMVEILTLGSVQESAITEGTTLRIGFDYSWGDRQYEYVASALWSESEREWKVVLERGG